MRIFLLVAFCLSLAACTSSDNPDQSDTTSVVLPDAPDTPLVAEQLVGRWANQNGTYVDFRRDGTVAVSGRDQRAMAFRVLGDSLVVSDSTILAAELIPMENRYHIQSLTDSELVLAPASGALGGSYVRDSAPVQPDSM